MVCLGERSEVVEAGLRRRAGDSGSRARDNSWLQVWEHVLSTWGDITKQSSSDTLSVVDTMSGATTSGPEREWGRRLASGLGWGCGGRSRERLTSGRDSAEPECGTLSSSSQS